MTNAKELRRKKKEDKINYTPFIEIQLESIECEYNVRALFDRGSLDINLIILFSPSMLTERCSCCVRYGLYFILIFFFFQILYAIFAFPSVMKRRDPEINSRRINN